MSKLARGRPSLRTHLINVARELLREEGPAALTARGLARRAGVVDATIFNNFGDLRGLLLAVGQEGFPEFDTLMTYIAGGPGVSVDDWLAEVFLLSRLYYIATLPLSVQQLATISPIRHDDTRLTTSITLALAEQLEKLQRAGRVLAEADLPAVATLFFGASAHAALTEFTAGYTSVLCDDPAELARRLVRQLALT